MGVQCCGTSCIAVCGDAGVAGRLIAWRVVSGFRCIALWTINEINKKQFDLEDR